MIGIVFVSLVSCLIWDATTFPRPSDCCTTVLLLVMKNCGAVPRSAQLWYTVLPKIATTVARLHAVLTREIIMFFTSKIVKFTQLWNNTLWTKKGSISNEFRYRINWSFLLEFVFFRQAEYVNYYHKVKP